MAEDPVELGSGEEPAEGFAPFRKSLDPSNINRQKVDTVSLAA
jgi:hypothetical protein